MLTADERNTGVGASARRCGLATALSYLCYRDRFVQRPGRVYDFQKELRYNTNNDADFVKFAEDMCEKLIGPLYIAPDVLAGSRAYMYAATDACFRIMVVYDRDNECGHKPYVISELIEEFERKPAFINGDDYFVDPVLEEVTTASGRRWFFCRPYYKYWQIMCGN